MTRLLHVKEDGVFEDEEVTKLHVFAYEVSLTIQNCPHLEEFVCSLTSIKRISVVDLPALRVFTCVGNGDLVSLEFDGADNLETLRCCMNRRLQPVDFVQLPGLVTAECYGNPMWNEIRLFNAPFLKHLDVRGCNLRSLNAEENRFLHTLRCADNPFVLPPLVAKRPIKSRDTAVVHIVDDYF